ncbi:MAG: Trp family transcriptional regulator [bacterium]|nr:Trp family transcriptional regulator [bacterium]
MTKISRRPLKQEKIGRLVNELWSAFTLMDSKDDVRLLFRDLFTHTEYKMFSKRLAIARLLLEDQSYNLIRTTLNVTPGTISHISNVLASKGEGYRRVHIKLKGIEQDHQRRIVKNQDRIERRVRRKIPSEIFLPDVLVASAGIVSKAIIKKIKKSSARKELSL